MSKYQITNNADLTTLDAHFKDNLYIGGHSPCSEDLLLFEQYTNANTEPCQDSHTNLWSWFALVSLYTPQVKETWRSVVAKSAPAAKTAAKPAAKPAPKKEEKPAAADDDFDLFGDDEGDDGAAALEELKKKKEEEKKGKKKEKEPIIQKSLILLNVKVWDPEQNYDELAGRILKIERDGLVWKTEYKLADVAFGVKMIVIGLVVEDEKVSVEDIIEELQSWEDDIQSVDIAGFNKI